MPIQKRKRIFLVSLKVLGLLSALAIVIGFLPLFLPGSENHDYVMMPNVEFSAEDFASELANICDTNNTDCNAKAPNLKQPLFMSNLHWLKPGQQTALVALEYQDPSYSTSDDERFEKVTILLPKVEMGKFNIDGRQIRAFYSTGGSAWPRSQCGHEIKDGSLEILEISSKFIRAKISFSGSCKKSDGTFKKDVSFSKETQFDLLPLQDATPWHGKPGGPIYWETYRRL